MQVEEVTFENLKGVAWAIYWRGVLGGTVAGYIAGFIVGFFLGFVSGFIGNEQIAKLIPYIGAIVGFVAGFCVFIWVLKSQLGRAHGQHSLILVENA